MHDPRVLREQADAVRAGVIKKAGQVPEQFDRFFALDGQRSVLLRETDELKRQRNEASEEIAKLKKSGQDAAERIVAMRAVGDRIAELDAQLRAVEEEFEDVQLWIPNVPHASVPEGRDASANVEVAR